MTTIGRTRGSRVMLDRAIELAVAVGVAILVAIGFITSYETLRLLAITDGGFAPWLAPAVPLSFDLGIVVLSLKIVAAARQGRHALVHRAHVAGLSVATVAVNGTASTGTAGRLLHAIPPAMFVICFENLVTDARRAALLGRPSRTSTFKGGLLAPVSTVRRWRDDVLQSRASDAPTKATAQPASRPLKAQRVAVPGRLAVAAMERPATGPDAREALVREALRHDPRLTAPALVRALHDHGHDVSVRTAQRLKSRVVSLP